MVSKRLLGFILLCIGGICVGLTGAYVKPLLDLLHPLDIAAVRSSVSALSIAIILFASLLFLRRKTWVPSWTDFRWLLAFGVVGIFGCNGATLVTVSQPGSSGVGLTIILVVSVVVARLCEHGLKALSRTEVALASSLGLGLFLLFGAQDAKLSVSSAMLAWAILAGILQGLMILIIVRLRAPLGWRLLVGFSIAAGLQLTIGEVFVDTSPSLVQFVSEADLGLLTWVAGGGILTLAAAYTFLNLGAQLNGSIVVSALALCLEPVAGLVADYLLHDEHFTLREIIGAITILAVVVIYNLSEQSDTTTENEEMKSSQA